MKGVATKKKEASESIVLHLSSYAPGVNSTLNKIYKTF